MPGKPQRERHSIGKVSLLKKQWIVLPASYLSICGNSPDSLLLHLGCHNIWFGGINYYSGGVCIYCNSLFVPGQLVSYKLLLLLVFMMRKLLFGICSCWNNVQSFSKKLRVQQAPALNMALVHSGTISGFFKLFNWGFSLGIMKLAQSFSKCHQPQLILSPHFLFSKVKEKDPHSGFWNEIQLGSLIQSDNLSKYHKKYMMKL